MFFVVLAILTVGALVGWNAIRQRSVDSPEIAQETSSDVTPTPESGTAVGRNEMGSLNGTLPATSSAGIGGSTKGGVLSVATSSAMVTPTQTVVQKNVQTNAQTNTSSLPEKNVIAYTDSGFNPKTFTIKSGTMVKFLNQSNKRMWVESVEVGNGKKLDQFNMGISVGRDGFYEFQFNSVGEWGYKDQLNPNQTATIIVTN